MAGLANFSSRPPRIALRQHYAITPWTDLVEVHWAEHLQAYVTPISRQEICVAFIGSKKLATSEEALDHLPSLRKRLATAAASGHPRGSVTSTRRLRRVSVRNIALIGDASGSIDAITGHGLSLAFRQAIALVAALEREDLNFYEAAHAELTRIPSIMSRALLLMDRYPFAANRAFKAFEQRPHLFSDLLGLHLGDSTPRILGSHGLLNSALDLLFA
jgi:2-polyprenyl-6-methoxyphenol hydroxylase-like FAD-dependent oxidoreductase